MTNTRLRKYFWGLAIPCAPFIPNQPKDKDKQKRNTTQQGIFWFTKVVKIRNPQDHVGRDMKIKRFPGVETFLGSWNATKRNVV